MFASVSAAYLFAHEELPSHVVAKCKATAGGSFGDSTFVVLNQSCSFQGEKHAFQYTVNPRWKHHPSDTWDSGETSGHTYTSTGTFAATFECTDVVGYPPTQVTRKDDCEVTVFNVEIKATDQGSPKENIYLNSTVSYKAFPDPGNLQGSYQWSKYDPGNKLQFVSGTSSQEVQVKGINSMATPDEAYITVSFTPTGSAVSASDTHQVTVFKLDHLMKCKTDAFDVTLPWGMSSLRMRAFTSRRLRFLQ